MTFQNNYVYFRLALPGLSSALVHKTGATMEHVLDESSVNQQQYEAFSELQLYHFECLFCFKNTDGPLSLSRQRLGPVLSFVFLLL